MPDGHAIQKLAAVSKSYQVQAGARTAYAPECHQPLLRDPRKSGCAAADPMRRSSKADQEGLRQCFGERRPPTLAADISPVHVYASAGPGSTNRAYGRSAYHRAPSRSSCYASNTHRT